MAMSASTLSTQLQSMTPTMVEATAISNFATAWATYFGSAAAGAAAYVPNPSHKSAMMSAMVGISVPGAGALAIQNGVTAFWVAVVSSLAFAGSIAVVPPPTLPTIATLLTPVFAANTAGALSLAASCTAIAAVLHTNNLGGTATLPPAVVTPIL